MGDHYRDTIYATSVNDKAEVGGTILTGKVAALFVYFNHSTKRIVQSLVKQSKTWSTLRNSRHAVCVFVALDSIELEA